MLVAADDQGANEPSANMTSAGVDPVDEVDSSAAAPETLPTGMEPPEGRDEGAGAAVTRHGNSQPVAAEDDGDAHAPPSAAPMAFVASRITVLQPLTPLKDVELPRRPPPPEDERAMLATWSGAMEQALRDGRPKDTVRMAHVVLRELPRHLGTYYRLIRAAWMLRRWDEGDAWGRRLLRADPACALAWRGVAMAAEYSGERVRAHARWRRAFECDPYEPETRAGLVRTSIDLARLPVLGAAAHASLLLRGYRWEQAAMAYARLTKEDPRRLDFQSGYLIALWQLRALPDAYEMARRLVQNQPYLLAAWLVIDQEGDINDKALARHPLGTMDPDGDYARMAMGLDVPDRPVRLRVSDVDKTMVAELTAA